MTKTHPAIEYVEDGLALCPIPRGKKGPKKKGWNQRENAITTPKAAAKLNGHNIGLLHEWSATCAIDIDNLKRARAFLSKEGIDLAELLNASNAVQIISGKKNRAKLIYRLPKDVAPLPYRKLADGALELRCAGRQDVLPPSIHPETGQPYKWRGNWREIPKLPKFVLAFWQKMLAEPPRVGTKKESIPEGERNDQIFRYACKLRRDGISDDEARHLILEMAARCDPPLGKKEALRCLASAWTYQEVFHQTDAGNARRFAADHDNALRYVMESERWIFWDGARWRVDRGDREAMCCAKDTARSLYTEAAEEKNDDARKRLARWAAFTEGVSRLKAMIELAKTEPGLHVALAELDADPWLLGVANGVIDLRTGRLRPARHDDLITKCASVNYDAKATCPIFSKFLNRIFEGDQNLISYVQRAAGYTLTGETMEKALFFLYGALGDNGKSTLIETLAKLFGDYAHKTQAEIFLEQTHRNVGPSPERIALQGARLVFASELSTGRRFNEAFIKDVTGGIDQISTRNLYKGVVTFKPQLKLWIYANHKPTIRGDDCAVWNRVNLIPFNVRIPKQEQDQQLPEKLKAELPGILNWALSGCLAWQKNGLQPPSAVRKATDAYHQEMDWLGQFLKDRCIERAEALVPLKTIFNAYVVWCTRNSIRQPGTRIKFQQRLAERGHPIKVRHKSIRWCIGLELKNGKN